MKNVEAISKFVAVNYKHDGTEMVMTIKKMENPIINMPEISEDTAIGAYIFVWENKDK